MDILLDPNVAYLLLVLGTFLALVAIIVPGTGMPEIGALFCFLLSGYAVYHLSFNWRALLVLIVSLAPFLYSIQRPKREVFLVLSILGLMVGSVFFFTESGRPTVHPVLAIIVSFVYAASLWIIIRKSIQAVHSQAVYDLAALMGMVGQSKTSVLEDGSVQVAGELWSARSEKVVPAGCLIQVIGREGFVLVIESLKTTK